jgi:hypothetical protein
MRGQTCMHVYGLLIPHAYWLLTGGRHDAGACTSQDSKAKLCLYKGSQPKFDWQIGEKL